MPTSTTVSSTSWPSRTDPAAVVIACGAVGGPIRDIAARRGWPVELHCLPAVLHNRPAAITPQVERLAVAAQARGLPVAIGYADCGTYGALDELSGRLGLRRLPGLHCYDLLAGPDRVAALFEAEPGTYVLTDFLVRSFGRTVIAGLGLDRYPELWPDYFGHYRRVVWLAQSRDPALEGEAEAVAARFGLPLTVIDTGLSRLERELGHLLAPSLTPADLPEAGSPGRPAPGRPGPGRLPQAPSGSPRARPLQTGSPRPALSRPAPQDCSPGGPLQAGLPQDCSPQALSRPAPQDCSPGPLQAGSQDCSPALSRRLPRLLPQAGSPRAGSPWAGSPAGNPLPDPGSSLASPLPPAPPTTAGLAEGFVINRSVLSRQHRSVDHENGAAGAVPLRTPQVTAVPQAPGSPAIEAGRCAAG